MQASERPRWGHDIRYRASEITVGGNVIGSAPVAIRPFGPKPPTIENAVRIEIRINAGQQTRKEFSGKTTSLSFVTSDGDTMTYEDVTWRKSCCRLIGYATP